MNLSDSWTAGQPLIDRTSAAESVFRALRGAIEDRRLAVGSKLSSEATLAAQYGVSRSVIREALRSCAALGLTRTETGRGTFVVADRPRRDLMLGSLSASDLVEARPHIEIPAAELAAQRRTADDIAELRGLMEAMRSEDDGEAWVELDAAFHAAIARASGNGVFARIVADIREALSHQSETINLVTGRQKTSDIEHQTIFEAIENQDVSAAASAMEAHLGAVRGAVADIVRNGHR
ncbi:FadR/GntR family transcriptional regulator [Arthrobacter sp. KK5.5]|uniref:FadR/GntR family transcriptional regulator n=1 Tax=Arthrobacter sp. KK5.5 TaxID=3373084 RepID=UPI003EE4F875